MPLRRSTPSAMIEAANPEDEALAIAVALREALHDGKTAALITPDRALGRRVLAALQRWNITAEDSGGDALADTPAGIFCPACGRVGARRHVADNAARLAQASAAAAWRAESGRHAGARDPARPAAARRQCRSRSGAGTFPRTARQISSQGAGRSASFRPADRANRRRACRRRAISSTRLRRALEPLESLGRNAYPLSELARRHRDVVAALSLHGATAVAL